MCCFGSLTMADGRPGSALGSMPLPRAWLRGVRVSPVPSSPGAREVAYAPMVRLGGLRNGGLALTEELHTSGLYPIACVGLAEKSGPRRRTEEAKPI